MNAQTQWESIYRLKAPDAVSWYRPHLDLSLDLIGRCAPGRSASIIDVGAGESTLVDDLLSRGYQHLAVLDISPTAIEATRQRLGRAADDVHWMLGDITQFSLAQHAFDVWHDRAVFHFLTDQAQRQAYVRSVLHAVKPGGHVIVSTFGPEGPTKCSGLDVKRYDAAALHQEFGRRFQIEESALELHRTPWGTKQQFVYCCCRVK
jgi:SAM-dependent methyltransferase